MDVKILKKISKEEIALEVIVKHYVEPLYKAKKLRTDIYSKIKDEIDVLHRKKKKQKDQKAQDSDEIAEVKQLDTKIEPKQSRNPQKSASLVHHGRQQQHTPRDDPRYSNQVNQYGREQQARQGGYGQGGSHMRDQNGHTLEDYKEAYTHEIGQYKDEIRQYKDVIIRLEKDIEGLNGALRNTRADSDSLRQRLSKIAGDKLKANNPYLADLSDSYRPTNLGKAFSELYDNEWSDAFEEIGRTIKDERQCIELLHGIVKSSFDNCGRKAKSQEEQIRDILLDIETDSEIQYKDECKGLIENLHNILVGVKKEIIPYASLNVAKNYIAHEFQPLVSAFDIKSPGKKLVTFAERCTELCWCMQVCDPPMGMSPDDQPGQPFDKNVYREYTRSVRDLIHPEIEWFVWPALYLNVGGSMVSKGVVQPQERQSQTKK